ncbi:polysaccharide biosynthesis tyrosine autokinase [Desulfosporosinus hippei]|uniref:non-specific protein-tyrosine kinase n=1 Tax=Desulfosporosinus hippei DSM 8344 TaxID=1121419 RepID=A0A1G8H1I0_9FIRM|nr:polysaccharide biosynthesis tyrosine autokinase [Desulfosporosinus hippei]SDI00542.1 receptor protein-tyrosine kinase [Desulfosporosinus hippei DSM 8344]
MEREIDLRRFREVLRKRWTIVLFLPLGVALICGTLSFLFSAQPIYMATATLAIGNPPTEVSQQNNGFNLDAILAGPQMAKIFEPVVKSRAVEQKVLDQLNLSLNIAQLDSKVTVNSVQDSDLIAISVTDTDPILAAIIANSMAEQFSEVVIEIKKVDTVSVLDRAVIPDSPMIVNKKQIVLSIGLIAFLLGLGIAFLLEYLDDSLRNRQDVEDILQLQVIGQIPYDSEYIKEDIESKSEGFWRLANSQSPAAEAFRTLRTNLQFNKPDSIHQQVLITSTGSGEGKSMMAVNLAISLVRGGKLVLIIDANLRNPIQHQYFQLSNDVGLTSILSSGLPGLEYVVQTQILGLDVLTSGPILPNPVELLDSLTMKNVLKEAKAAYDVVIIDSPPTLARADASILAQAVDGVIFVVGAGAVSREYALEAKRQLEKVEAKILGVVINKVNLKSLYDKYSSRSKAGFSVCKRKILKRSKFRNPSKSFTA